MPLQRLRAQPAQAVPSRQLRRTDVGRLLPEQRGQLRQRGAHGVSLALQLLRVRHALQGRHRRRRRARHRLLHLAPPVLVGVGAPALGGGTVSVRFGPAGRAADPEEVHPPGGEQAGRGLLLQRDPHERQRLRRLASGSAVEPRDAGGLEALHGELRGHLGLRVLDVDITQHHITQDHPVSC